MTCTRSLHYQQNKRIYKQFHVPTKTEANKRYNTQNGNSSRDEVFSEILKQQKEFWKREQLRGKSNQDKD